MRLSWKTSSLGFEDNFRFGAEYQSNNNLLKFKITEINDSRCPAMWFVFGRDMLKLSLKSGYRRIVLSTLVIIRLIQLEIFRLKLSMYYHTQFQQKPLT